MKVLHITDLHLHQIDGGGENLRKGFFRQFLDELVDKIFEQFEEENPIDLVVATGDFVNKALFENFPHAKSILVHLLDRLGLPESSCITCIGNHDLNFELEKEGKIDEARQAYTDFAKDFVPDAPLMDEEFFQIYRKTTRSDEEVFILSMDSTYNCQGNNVPGVLSQGEIEFCANAVYENVPRDSALIIACHYPFFISEQVMFPLEEDDWVSNHFWKSGRDLWNIIRKGRQKSITISFFGDGHQPFYLSVDNNHHFLMTGMIGGNYSEPFWNKRDADGDVIGKIPYSKTNEIRVVSVSDTTEIYTFKFVNKGSFKLKSSNGVWSSKQETKKNYSVSNSPQKDDSEIQPEQVIEPSLQTHIEIRLIGHEIQRQIISRIRERKIYTLNRYTASSEKVSLGWVSMNRLLSNDKHSDKNLILPGIIDKSVKWIMEDLKLNVESIILIGIDFWGSIIASNIAVRIGARPVCFTMRKEGRIMLGAGSANPEFGLFRKVVDSIGTLTDVLIITDVISSGYALSNVAAKIRVFLEEGPSPRFSALSIIADKNQKREKDLAEFAEIASFCTDLPIPVLDKADLPEEDILPPKISHSPSIGKVMS